MTYSQILDLFIPFTVGFVLSAILFLIAWRASARIRGYALHKAAEAEASANRNNVNAGRGWATAAQLAPYLVYAIALTLSISLLPIDLSAIVGALAAGAFGIALAVQDLLRGLAAKVVIVGSDLYRVGDDIGYDDAILTVVEIGPTHTEFIDHARDARRIVPNATLVNADIINYDDVEAAKMVMTLPIDSTLTSEMIDRLEAGLSKAIERFSVGAKQAEARYINQASDAWEFRLVGFTDRPVEHPAAMPAMYKTAAKAALDLGFSVGRTNNNTFGNPLHLLDLNTATVLSD